MQVRNRLPYSFDSGIIASNIYKNAVGHVDQIYSDVKDSTRKAGSELYGEEHCLKTVESIKRKIEKRSHEDGVNINEAAQEIKDAVRFTTISSDDDFVSNYISFKKSMEEAGYEETRCKNYFEMYRQGKVKHKSVQSNYITPDGYEFEVQFQTPSSQDAKNKKAHLYEEVRQVGISKRRVTQIEKEMVKLAESVADPIDICNIKSHYKRKED